MIGTCSECGRTRERCRPSVRHVGGAVDLVCPQCWRGLQYGEFMCQPGCVCPHCQAWRQLL